MSNFCALKVTVKFKLKRHTKASKEQQRNSQIQKTLPNDNCLAFPQTAHVCSSKNLPKVELHGHIQFQVVKLKQYSLSVSMQRLRQMDSLLVRTFMNLNTSFIHRNKSGMTRSKRISVYLHQLSFFGKIFQIDSAIRRYA